MYGIYTFIYFFGIVLYMYFMKQIKIIIIAELFMIWMAQLVKRSYVKQETLGSTPGSGQYVSTINPLLIVWYLVTIL